MSQNFRSLCTTAHKSSCQRGAATLLIIMVFLLSTSIIMLYLNRNIIFEQKISANQMRSTQALEMAEAGLEWATGMLNSPYDISTSCVLLTTTNISFRKKYVLTNWGNGTSTATSVAPATTTYPGCKINGNTWTCNCPNVPNSTTDLGAAELPSFTVSFSAAGTDAEAVTVTSIGCTAQTGACTPSTASSSDATATVTTILKLRPTLRATPPSPLTCGTTCTIGTANTVTNTDVNTGGVLVNAGGAIDPKDSSLSRYTSIPGQPPLNAIIANDSSVSALASTDPTCSNSAMFKAYFGSTIAQYAASSGTKTIANCDSANSCGSLVDAAYADGWRSFYFPDGFARNNSSGSLGSVSDPVTLVSATGFDVRGNIDIYGMVFANSATVSNTGFGTANINGAVVTCAAYDSNGAGTLAYNATVLEGVRRSTGSMVRVPGSWTDRCTRSTAHPPVLSCN